jgi:signal transduction histidine kinase
VPPEILRGKVRNLLVLYDQGIELEKRAALLTEQHQRILAADAAMQERTRTSGSWRTIFATRWLRSRPAPTCSRAFRRARSKRAATVERIHRSAQRMTRLIRDILDYTRGQLGGGIPLKRQPTDLAAISRSVVEEILAGYPVARIEVETAGKLTGHWDPARIEQALSNLIAKRRPARRSRRQAGGVWKSQTTSS